MFPSSFGKVLAQLKGKALQAVLGPLASALDDPEIARSLARPGTFVRKGLYSIKVTFLMYLAQCLDADHSCRSAVAAAKAAGLLPDNASPDTAAYCRARNGLSDRGTRNFALETGRKLEATVDPDERWCGRVVKIVDGTGVALPDTKANQASFPQPRSQAKGCGFPVMTLVGLMSLATGAILHYVCSSWHRGEATLFAKLQRFLQRGEVVLGDRGFCSFAAIAVLLKKGVDAVFRVSAARWIDLRKGKRLGPGDRLVEWSGPDDRPKWLGSSVTLPNTLRLRVLRFTVEQRGFRTKAITLVTTLLDPAEYSARDLADLYRRRWSMELWLRDSKITLGMDVLRTKTPLRVRTELAMFVLGYNLVRAVMRDAVCAHGAPMGRVSFKSTLARIRHWPTYGGRKLIDLYGWLVGYEILLDDLVRDLNPDRPNRIEPRVLKRRKKAYPLMTKPRKVLQALAKTG